MVKRSIGGGNLISHIVAFGLGMGSVAALGFIVFEVLKPKNINVQFGDDNTEPESQGFFGIEGVSGTQGYDVDTSGYKREFDPMTYPILGPARDLGAYMIPWRSDAMPNPWTPGDTKVSLFPGVAYV